MLGISPTFWEFTHVRQVSAIVEWALTKKLGLVKIYSWRGRVDQLDIRRFPIHHEPYQGPPWNIFSIEIRAISTPRA